MAKKKLRVAFIGAGGIAGTHMREYSKMDDVEMVAMADISTAGMERLGDEYGIPDAFTDYKAMLRKIKPTVYTRRRALRRFGLAQMYSWRNLSR